ncbi:hypothetical protein WJX73_000330 [Symbiochloris irregularis]|uniref:Uncharacterized protein n=1 Tax=Symbiochloris irregularis TaxID=706552 RepID=A0AAW1P6R4_9CHLO
MACPSLASQRVKVLQALPSFSQRRGGGGDDGPQRRPSTDQDWVDPFRRRKVWGWVWLGAHFALLVLTISEVVVKKQNRQARLKYSQALQAPKAESTTIASMLAIFGHLADTWPMPSEYSALRDRLQLQAGLRQGDLREAERRSSLHSSI